MRHYVLLSIVGVGAGLQGGGYLRGKVLQEMTVAASGVPYTIVRATQFHELTELITAALIVDGTVHAPDALIQPIAADDVATEVADVATGTPVNGVRNIAGPEPMAFAAMAKLVLAQQGTDIPVLTDPTAAYFGVPVQRSSMVPGPDGQLSATSLAEWLAKR
ncbi:SDR family oxidoreductase [Mycobacterium sp. MS1601]|uniref:SDR family oxidoreductase n=1 Tax=Mycobacterium sp. MS1601 TaxID=1936029 RepID=UPI0030012F07